MTVSPRTKSFGMNRSRSEGAAPFFRGGSVHISLAFSSIRLKCLSKALSLPKSFLLFRQLTSTNRCPRTASVSFANGVFANSSSAAAAVVSGNGLAVAAICSEDNAVGSLMLSYAGPVGASLSGRFLPRETLLMIERGDREKRKLGRFRRLRRRDSARSGPDTSAGRGRRRRVKVY